MVTWQGCGPRLPSSLTRLFNHLGVMLPHFVVGYSQSVHWPLSTPSLSTGLTALPAFQLAPQPSQPFRWPHSTVLKKGDICRHDCAHKQIGVKQF